MRRWMIVFSTLMLLISVLAVPVSAISIGSGGGYSGGDSDGSSGSSPVVGEGKAKDLSGSNADVGGDEAVAEVVEETVWATEDPDYTEEPLSGKKAGGVDEVGGAGEAGGGLQAPVSPPASETLPDETREALEADQQKAAENAEESLMERLFVRKVSHKEMWKLVVPALGAAAALAVLVFMGKKDKDSKASAPAAEEISKTTIQP